MKKKILMVIVGLGLIGAGVGYYLITEKAETVNINEADFKVVANDMYTEFVENEDEAIKKYTNKVVQIKGKMADIEKYESGVNVFLDTDDDMNQISCNIDKSIAEKLQSKKKW